MDRCAESFLPVLREACGDAHIGGSGAAGEGMGGHVEAPILERVPHLLRHLAAQRLLLGNRPALSVDERGVRRVARGICALLGNDGLEKRDEAEAYLGKDLVQTRRRHTALELVERAIVRLGDARTGDSGNLSLERKHLFELGCEGGKVGLLPRGTPRGECLRLELRLPLSQLRALPRLLVKVGDCVTHVGAHLLGGQRLEVSTDGVDGVAHLVAGGGNVAHLGKRRLLRRARRCRSRGHEALLVVPENAVDFGQRVDVTQELLEGLVLFEGVGLGGLGATSRRRHDRHPP